MRSLLLEKEVCVCDCSSNFRQHSSLDYSRVKMQAVNGHGDNFGNIQFVNETDTIINGEYGYKRSAGEAGFDDSDSDGDHAGKRAIAPNPLGGPKPGKKTRGRVKIEMRFIDNKLRRYTTFSKRKTGIMKKAYELSTLTGTQVMLLVASETGHVYTFATRKLQPMITSESGKALIQTCLNSPDIGGNGPTPDTGIGSLGGGDQRMNPGGYEETELNYSVDDDQPKTMAPSPGSLSNKMLGISPSVSPKPRTPYSDNGGESSDNQTGMNPTPPPPSQQHHHLQSQQQHHHQPQQLPTSTMAMTSYLGPPAASGAKSTSMTMHLPTTPSISTILPQPAPAGMAVATPVPTTSSQNGAAGTVQYKIPNGSPGQSQIISLQGFAPASNSGTSSAVSTSSVASVAAPQPMMVMAASAGGGAPMMYQTPQGLIYAAAASTDGSPAGGYLLNLPQQAPMMAAAGGGDAGAQGAAAAAGHGGQQQHYITIPVPVSLAQAGQMFQQFIQQQPQAASGASDKK